VLVFLSAGLTFLISVKSNLNRWCSFLCLAGVALATPARAAAAANPEGTPSRLPGTGEFVFQLLPKAFQKSPQLEMTVVTEFTPYGRLLRPVSPNQPAYFVVQPGGYKQLGDTVGGEVPPPPADLERAMIKALATNGFLPAAPPAHFPNLAVFYTWGSHNKISPEMAARFPLLAARHMLERATLVGGRQFMAGINRRLEFGDSILDHNERMDYLTDQADDDLYFMIASAYDYASLAQGKRQLVWRTSMTANARGVALRETILPLIATGASYLGRETDGPEIAMRRISREGRVIIGESVVVPDKETKTPPPPPAPAASGNKKP
jgi:hypothetical protein